MIAIKAENLSVDFPLYHFGSRSLKKNFANIIMRNRVNLETSRMVVKSLCDVSLDIKPGDRVGLFGRNGAGKTTLLKVLSGIYQPTSGSLNVVGRIGSLVEIGGGIDPFATSWENIDLNLAFKGIPRGEARKIRAEIGAASGLGDFLNLPVRNYSAGMSVRLSFAMETIGDPEILLMDEWLSAGDAEFISYCNTRLSEMVETAQILVLASHNVELLKKWCSRIVVLEDGQVVDDRPAQNFAV